MREEPEFFHNKWCATRLFLETRSLQCRSKMCFVTMEDKNGNAGLDFGDILSNLIDRRFADDILLFANLGPEVALRFNSFVKMLADARFRLNVDKIKVKVKVKVCWPETKRTQNLKFADHVLYNVTKARFINIQ